MLINQQTDNKTVTQKPGFFSGLIRNIRPRKKTQSITQIQNVDPEDSEIIMCLRKARNDWIGAYQDFDYAGEQDLIDFHTYRIKAYQLRYEYFLKKAKERGIKCSGIEEEIILDSINSKS